MKYLVKTCINCNTSEDISTEVFDSYEEAKEYFDVEVKSLVESYMEDDDTFEDWLDKEEGIIVEEYGGTVSERCVAFDFNVIELTEI
jgi:hypothetical protein